MNRVAHAFNFAGERGRRVLPFVAISLVALLAGCQAAPGPGVRVELRAEPKQGYTPPEPGDVGYGAAADAQPAAAAVHDHDFHLIDYRRLGGIVVWAEPDAYAAARGTPAGVPPLNAVVELSNSRPAAIEDVYVASVGGAVTFDVAAALDRGQFILRTERGEISDLPAAGVAFVPTRPGLVEVLSDAGDDQPRAFLYVAPTPWARRASGGERVTLAPLPPGRYVVRTWHPILPGTSQPVVVGPEKQLAKLKLSVGVNALPKPK